MGKNACIFLIWIACVASGCGQGPPSVYDSDPAEKAPAIEIAVRNRDRRVIPQLVKDLENEDSAIRFYAIDGLRALTGENFGYRFFDDEEQRRPAVKRWQDWLARQSR